jgi:hypothetical protein
MTNSDKNQRSEHETEVELKKPDRLLRARRLDDPLLDDPLFFEERVLSEGEMNYFGDVPEAEIQRINRAAKHERQTGKWLAVKRKRSSR